MGKKSEIVEGAAPDAVTMSAETPENAPTVAPEAVQSVDANFVPENSTTPSGEGEPVTLNTLVDDHAIEPVKVDEPGTLLKADGTPAKKRGRKPGGTNRPKVSASAGYALPPKDAPIGENAPLMGGLGTETAPGQMSPEIAGRWSANLLFNAGALFFGADIAAPSKDEKAAIPQAFKDYYELKGTPNIPPEIALIMAVGVYIAPRIMHEKMAEKRGGIRAFFGRLFRRAPAPAQSAPDTGAATEKVEPVQSVTNAGKSKMGWAG
jgi:hypothetical protein